MVAQISSRFLVNITTEVAANISTWRRSHIDATRAAKLCLRRFYVDSWKGRGGVRFQRSCNLHRHWLAVLTCDSLFQPMRQTGYLVTASIVFLCKLSGWKMIPHHPFAALNHLVAWIWMFYCQYRANVGDGDQWIYINVDFHGGSDYSIEWLNCCYTVVRSGIFKLRTFNIHFSE